MISPTVAFRFRLVLWFVAATSPAFGQSGDPYIIGSPFNTTAILNAPFSADATTTITQTRPDGTIIKHLVTARYYRDSEGRVRVESDIVGATATQPKMFIVIHANPDDRLVYSLNPLNHTAHRWPLSWAARFYDSGNWFSIPVGVTHYKFRNAFGFHDPRTEGASESPLGSRTIEGMSVVGRRISLIHKAGMEITADLWESADLKLLLSSRISDPRADAVLEYQLSNISRANPSPNLFVVPPDHTKHIASAEDPAAHLQPLR